MLKPLKLLVFLPLTVLISCGSPTADSDEQTVDSTQTTSLVVDDVHSYSNVNEVNSTHLHLNLSVDFEQRILNGSVVHSINNTAGTNKMIFDIRDVEISKVTLDDGTETTFEIGEADDLLGAALTVDISPETKEVEIFFATTPESEALQWLNPQQTAGKKHPYLFTQGQAVLTRTWIPCQDTPGNRITYSADIQVPTDLLAVMSADNPTEKMKKENTILKWKTQFHVI